MATPRIESHAFPRSWKDLIGHERIRSTLSSAIAKRRLGGSLLFVGPPGVGKTAAALLLAQTVLCRRQSAAEMNPCGQCPDCAQVRAATHPDLIQVSKPQDKSLIPLELLIGPVEARLQEGFCHDVHLRPMQGERKVAILHDADFLNEEGANCLLKTLEEPPANAVIILIGTSEQRQLPTIRSRCQTMRFTSPTGVEGRELLRQHIQRLTEAGQSPPSLADAELDEAIELAAGDLQVATRLASGQSNEIRGKLLTQLSASVPDPMIIARCINSHLDEISKKEAPLRRAGLRDLCSIAVQYYRGELREAARQGRYNGADARRLDRTLRVFREIDRSANLNALVDCYAADLSLAITGDRGSIG
ncbi:ATP-binding protein [Allorhodopirellula heiligendammensis]|uniref:DNA polymerase III subunit tau n=1 Tax=Allorhodopirellula heiligendammensis TaxID=2714739 RepID=A0A5C6BY48_9BACT|nr:DNA polymerase III subunit delta' [Allorhodopirellula heiligendammensis]TWU16577.1 DNA polymerase III subunit tau [Allorhodopirellula heiligendammensis]